jgi:hypothetical protein
MTTRPVEPLSGEPKAKAFISYSRTDMAFADRLEAAMKASALFPTNLVVGSVVRDSTCIPWFLCDAVQRARPPILSSTLQFAVKNQV